VHEKSRLSLSRAFWGARELEKREESQSFRASAGELWGPTRAHAHRVGFPTLRARARLCARAMLGDILPRLERLDERDARITITSERDMVRVERSA
jgi:hypothetical protein